jgi:RNA polymerase sigma-70 factor (ECF subfamily)
MRIALLRRDLAGLSDPLLVERVKERDDASAFDEIVRRHKNRIYSYVCRMTHDAPDAEDLTQEVFIRAYQSIHRFRADAAVDTWLYRIATNLVIDRFRRTQRAPQAWVPLDDEEDALGSEGLSYEEVAEALGCPVGTIKSRLFNGRSLLRRKLAHYVESD